MSPSKSKNLTPSYAVIQGLYWMYFAAIMSFSGFFLLSGGFTNTQIGILAAIAGLLSAVLQPVLAGYADQPQSPSLKKLIQMLYFLQLILVIYYFYPILSYLRTSLWFQYCPSATDDSFY
ncbi:MAG: hypothetical protein ACLVB1_01115 [Blautia obeum]